MELNVQKLIESCDFIQRVTCIADGCIHGSARSFDYLMRAFTGKLPAESVTLKVFLNVPVSKYAHAEFFRDGTVRIYPINE